jgi:hypothetical protein
MKLLSKIFYFLVLIYCIISIPLIIYINVISYLYGGNIKFAVVLSIICLIGGIPLVFLLDMTIKKLSGKGIESYL